MSTRSLAFCIATIVAAAPLAAQAGGDFRLNAVGTRGLPSLYSTNGCQNLGVDGNKRLSWAKCTRNGAISIRQSYADYNSSKCDLRVWETGVFKFTWHAEFTKNENTVCSIRWADDDTLDLTIHN